MPVMVYFRSRPDRLRCRLRIAVINEDCLCALLTDRSPAAAEAISALPTAAAGAFLKEAVALLAVHCPSWAGKYTDVILYRPPKECNLLARRAAPPARTKQSDTGATRERIA